LVAVFRYICIMMKKWVFVISVYLFYIQSYAQIDSTFVDDKYFEDQFYIGFNYNSLLDQPENFSQNGLSGGIELGYTRDIPINKERNFGLGIGVGYAFNSYIQNMKITSLANETVFEVISSELYSKNRLITHLIEVPITIRWRTSTPAKYKFWRVYGGAKLGYVFSSLSRYEDSIETIKTRNIDELKGLQYGLTLAVGYGSLNLHLYYGLNDMFKDAEVNNEPIDIKQFNIGLIFYML